MTEFELKILRECAGEIPPSPWGAAVGAVLESLRGNGYIDHQTNVTEKGREVLRASAMETRQMADYDISIHTNPDARAWARFYTECRNASDDPANFDSEENMFDWFANAMMAMHDHLTGQRVVVLDDGSAFFVVDVDARTDGGQNG